MAKSKNILQDAKRRRAEELLRAQRLPEARAAFEQLCQQSPRDFDLWLNLGVINGRLGIFDAAEAAFKKALMLRDNEPRLYVNLARLCDLQGRFDEEINYCRSYLRLQPNDADAYAQMGKLLHKAGRLSEAEQALHEALRLNPNSAVYYYNAAVILCELGRLDEALACYLAALRLNQNMDEVHGNLGNLYHKRGEYALAESSYIAALNINPVNVDSQMNLGCHYLKMKRYDEAKRCFEMALRIAPEHADAHMNLGCYYLETGALDEALRCFKEALRIAPDSACAHMNLGCYYLGVERRDEAMRSFEEAVRIAPDYAAARWNISCLLLLTGNFSDGWREYEWRFRCDETAPPDLVARYSSKPLWDGSPLVGQTLLVYFEQGYGDTLQSCRYLPLVRQRVEHVVFECQPELYRLLTGMFGDIELIKRRSGTLPDASYDLQIPIMSLPRLFGTVMDSIPNNTPYIHADPQLVEYWRQRLNSSDFKVGVVWAGNPNFKGDQKRSLSLTALTPLGDIQDVCFYSLQKGPAAAEVVTPPAGMRLIDLAPELNDFATTAAVIANLDLVIAVDTAVAHLAGAMGKPVWALIYSPPDWRWLLDRDDTPWYPTMRLFRQSAPGEWGPVIERVAEALPQERSKTILPS